MSHIITLMPSDNYLSEDKTIWDQRVREQYKKIIAHHEFRKAGVVKKILKFLIENELGEKDDIRQKDILEKVIGRGDLSNVSHRVGEMRAKLDIYYRDRPDDDIVIVCPEGKYELSIQSISETAATNDAGAGHERVGCYFVGGNMEALEYLIRQMPRLVSFRDVHSRPEHGHASYDAFFLDALRDGVRKFLNEDRDNRLELLVGQIAERRYVEAFTNAAEGQEKKVKCFRLRRSGPLMNFVLLDYSEGKPEKEVLFGWGRYGHRSSESVFRSSHHRLVLEFEKLYDNLSKSSDSLSITQLPESIAALAESPTISADWDMGRIYQLFNNAGKGSEIRILTTGFMGEEGIMFEEFRKLIKRGVHIKIVLMNHRNDKLVKARFERRRRISPLKAKATIREHLKTLQEISAEHSFPGSLEVKESNLMPFGFFIQSDETILMGLLPPTAPYSGGPMIETRVNSKLGQFLMENWEEYWNPKSTRGAASHPDANQSGGSR